MHVALPLTSSSPQNTKGLLFVEAFYWPTCSWRDIKSFACTICCIVLLGCCRVFAISSSILGTSDLVSFRLEFVDRNKDIFSWGFELYLRSWGVFVSSKCSCFGRIWGEIYAVYIPLKFGDISVLGKDSVTFSYCTTIMVWVYNKRNNHYSGRQILNFYTVYLRINCDSVSSRANVHYRVHNHCGSGAKT